MPIIRRNNCIYVTLGTCHSVWVAVWYVCLPVIHIEWQEPSVA